MKLLFVCTTELQLLTALNMKYNVYKDDVADIIVDNYHGEEAELAERIRQTNMFRHVCFVKSHIEHRTMHAYLRGITDGKKNVALTAALKNSGFFIWSRIKLLISGAEGWLSVLVNGFKTLPFSEYDEAFSHVGKPVVRHIRSYLEKINPSCKIVGFDEGVSSYIYGKVGDNSQIDCCEVYEPGLMQYRIPAKKIPAINKEDKQFVNIVNRVFEYDTSKIVDLRDSIIYFDQGVLSPMPKYLRNASFLKKIIFHNSYKKHKEEEKKHQKYKQLTVEILKAVGDKKVWIKPHPRSVEGALSVFTDMPNVEILPQPYLPWEIMALNFVVDNSFFMTIYSAAACLYHSVVQPSGNNKSILLYNLLDSPVDETLINYAKDLRDFFPNKIFIPKDKDDFLSFWENTRIQSER